jgi:ATP-dependent helicase/DNAse subunit B
VFVLGLTEGEFPSRSERPALLTEAQRDRLDAVGGGLFSPEADEEEALFVRAISRAWSHLFLSSRDADDAGGYEGQSYYWIHCKSLLGATERDHIHRTLADQVFEPSGAPTLRQYLRVCAARDLKPYPRCGCASLPTSRWHGEGAEARLASDIVLDELAATPSFSPSALESYLACPFKWFLERVVGIEDLETVVDNRLLGQYLHKVLSDAYQELRTAHALPLTADRLGLAKSVAASGIEALVDSEECPGTPAQRRLVEYQLKSMTSALFAMEVAAANARLLEATELTVGGREGVDVGGLTLRGRIDRVDSDGSGGLFVIDYKRGSIPEKRKIGTAEGLQLPLYILALGAERPEQRVTGGVYVSPRKRERAGLLLEGCAEGGEAKSRACRLFDEDGMEQMLRAALGLAREAADGIRSGSIAPRADRKCPEWCALGPACRRRRAGGRYRR